MVAQELRNSIAARPVSRRQFVRLAAGLASGTALTALVGACAVPPAPSTVPTVQGGAPVPSGGLVIAADFSADILDPHQTKATPTSQMLAHIFDGLRREVSGGTRVFHLLESMEQTDTHNYLFHLRKGVQFTNGETFDASVFKFNYDRFVDPATGSWADQNFFDRHKGCEVIDDYTIKWTTNIPIAGLLDYLGAFNLMMSPKAVAELGKDTAIMPIGSGPFQFVEWTPGDRFVVEANLDYWMGPPKLAKATWRPITEAATRIVELKTGGVDMAMNVPAESMADLEETGGITTVSTPSNLVAYIYLNFRRDYFQDVRVRQALNLAIDREAIAKSIFFGAARPQVTFLGPMHEGYDPNLEPYPYDPEKAKSLLAEAGYSTGLKFQLSGPSGRYPKGPEVLEAVAAYWEDVGVTVDLSILEWSTFLGQFIDDSRPFDAGYIGQGHSATALNEITTCLYSKSPAAWYGWQNTELETLYDQALGTFDDAKRDAIIRRMRRIIYDECPLVFIVEPQLIAGISDNVKDLFLWGDGGFWLREGDGCYKA